MAIFHQERHVELVSGADQAFVVTSLMASAIIPDELPHLSVFVMRVVDPGDPKQDTLARVARVADLTLVPVGRDAGIAAPGADGTQYLSASATLSYETLEIANDAAKALQDRVNALIEAWILFRTQFNAPDPSPAIYVFPRVDATQKAALISAYKAAKQDRYQRQLARAESDAALGRAQADYAHKQGLVTGSTTASSSAATNQSQMAGLAAGLGSLVSAGNLFLSAAIADPPTAGQKAGFQAALTVATTLQSAAIGYVSDAAALAALVASQQASRVAEAALASTALIDAQADQIAKAQQATSAAVVEAAALAAVLAVCPDFDSSSIPLVDG